MSPSALHLGGELFPDGTVGPALPVKRSNRLATEGKSVVAPRTDSSGPDRVELTRLSDDDRNHRIAAVTLDEEFAGGSVSHEFRPSVSASKSPNRYAGILGSVRRFHLPTVVLFREAEVLVEGTERFCDRDEIQVFLVLDYPPFHKLR